MSVFIHSKIEERMGMKVNETQRNCERKWKESEKLPHSHHMDPRLGIILKNTLSSGRKNVLLKISLCFFFFFFLLLCEL